MEIVELCSIGVSSVSNLRITFSVSDYKCATDQNVVLDCFSSNSDNFGTSWFVNVFCPSAVQG